MNRLPALIEAIENADAQLKAAALDDSETLATCLSQRADLISQAAGLIDQLRNSGQPVSPETSAALYRSRENGDHTLRQLILAKHQLATQLTQLKQEQRLLNDLTVQPPAAQTRLCDVIG